MRIIVALLLVVFNGKTDALIPLYAIGVFLSFTIAQGALVLRWVKEKRKSWIRKSVINGVGSLVSLLVLIIFCITKFMQGAWIVVVLIPILVYALTVVHKHYNNVAAELRVNFDEPLPEKGSIIIIPISGIHRVVVSTVAYAKTLSPNIVVFYVAFNDEEARKMEDRWEKWNPGVRLVIFKSRYRTITKPLLEFIDRVEKRVGQKDIITVLLPQFVVTTWWKKLLHNQSAFRIRSILLKRKDIVIATVPYHLQRKK